MPAPDDSARHFGHMAAGIMRVLRSRRTQ